MCLPPPISGINNGMYSSHHEVHCRSDLACNSSCICSEDFQIRESSGYTSYTILPA